MNRETNLRRLRLRHGVTLVEMARASGVPTQQISRAELGEISPTHHQESRMARVVEAVIERRRSTARDLEADYLACRGKLLQAAEAEDDEQ